MEPFLSPEMADIDNNLVLVDGQLVKKSECVKMVVTTSLRNFAARARLDILVKDLPEYLAQQHQLVHADGGYVTPAKVEFTTSLYGLTISQVAAPPDFTLADLLEDAEQILLVKLYFAQDLANEAVGPDPVQPINRSRSGSQQPIQLTLPVDRLAQQQPGSNQQPRARSQEHSNQLLAPQEQPAAAADGLAGMAISVADHPAALATAAAGITEGEERAGARERESAPRKSRKQRKGQADSTAEQLHEAQQPATSIDDAYDALAVLPSQSADEPLPDAAAAEHAAVPTAHECNDAGTQDAATAKKLRKEEKKARKRARRAADAAAADPCIAEVVSEADAPASALVQAAEPAVSQGLLDHPSGSKETQNAGAKAEGTAAAGPVSQAVDGVAACSQPTHHGEQQKKKKKQKHSHRRAGPSVPGGAGAGEAKPAAEDAATKPPKATKRRKQSNSGVSKADAAALTPLQGTSAAKTTLVKPSCQHEPMEQPAGAASASETSMSSAEEARQAAARARQRLEEAAIIFGPCVRPEPKQPEPTEEESMAGRTSAHAKNGDRKASIKAPNSDGRAAQQALTSSKGNAAVKKHAANLPQEPAATIAAAAQDQADAAAPGLAAKAAVAEAVDGATVPRSSKSAAEKQKRKADQAGTSSKAAAPGQAKTATPGAQMDEKKKKNSKKSKADQDVQQEPPAVQGAADKVITASQRAQSAARPAEKGSPADASQRIKSPTSAGKATDWKTRSRPNTELGGKKALGGTPAVNDSAVGGLAARVAGADALAMMPPIPGPRLTEGTHPMGAANGDPSSSKHGKQRSGNDTLLAQAGGRSQKAGAGLKRQTQAKQVTSETEGANQSELKTSPTSSYSSDDSSSVDSSDSEEEEVGPTQVVLDPEAVTTPGPSATSLSSSDDSSVDSESSAEFQEDVPKTQEVVAGNGGDNQTEADHPLIDPNSTPKASGSSDTGSGSTLDSGSGREEESPAQLGDSKTDSGSDEDEEDDTPSPVDVSSNEARSEGNENAKGIQAEEQQGAAGNEEGSASDEEDKREGRSSDEEAGHAGAAQADIVPESPCSSKQSEVLRSPAPSKRRSKPTSPGQEAFVEADDDELLQEVACRPWADWGRVAKLSSVVKRALKLCINKRRLLNGEKPVHQLYTDDLRPDWWPMPEWTTHQTDRKADCQKVYEALQQYLKATGMHHD
ncbi:hypothetical protein WJX79_001517 [Trebouxia sp. C0005]